MNNEIKQRIEQINAGQVPEGYKKEFGYTIPNDWNVYRAGMVFKNISIKNNNGDLQVLSVTQDKGVVPRDEVGIDIKYDKNSLPTYKKVRKGNFIISLRSFQGGLEYSGHEGLVSPAYTVLENILPIDDYYYTCYLKTTTFISRLDSAVYGIRDGKQIGYSDFCIIPIHYPPVEEQQKIAHILSNLDRVIELKQNLLEEKQKQKKWLMQKLLTGEIRLEGFNGEWKEFKLGDIGTFKNGINKDKEDFGIGRPMVNLMDIFGKSTVKNSEFGLVNANDNEVKEYSLKKGDVLFVRSSVKPSGVGLTSLVLEDLYETTYSGFLIRFRENNNCLDFNFKKYCFYNEEFRNRLLAKSTISANTNINQQALKSLEISIPIGKQEQKAIATILSIADQGIELLQKQIDHYKELKTSLMQLLLTGVARVKVPAPSLRGM